MTITVSGLGSGLNYDTWIEELVAVKQSAINKVNNQVSDIGNKEDTLTSLKSIYSSFLDSVQVFTDTLSSSSTNLFNQKSATSSSTAVTATADYTATSQHLNVSVSQLATATVAESTSAVASYVSSTTKVSDISEGAIDEGYFSVYVNGTKNKISITSNETLGDIKDAISSTLGTNGTVSITNDGKLSITANDSNTSITIGSSSDTSNFVNVMALEKETNTTTGITSYTSSNSLYDTNVSAALTDTQFAADAAGDKKVTDGTFSINGVSFTITTTGTTTGTTLDDLINTINKSKAGVSAYWDATAGKLSFTSTDTGATSIDIEAGTSNFTDIMGFTSSSWTTTPATIGTDGTTTSPETRTLSSTSLIDDAQTLGKNAKVKINGTTITSASNTITSDLSGLKGVTLTLNSETTSSAQVTVSQDTSKLESAITTFVSSLNSVITATNNVTSSNGDLYGETALNTIKNKIRSLATASVDGTEIYKSLSAIGITTGAIGTSVKANTDKLTIDTSKLEEALKSNPDAVKSLFLGDGTNDGIMDKMKTVISKSLDTTNGFFASTEKSFESQTKQLNSKITRMTASLSSYQSQLETKFGAMDKLISSLESSASIFDSYFNKKSSSSS